MADDVTPQLGERVVTSGHGGIYPAGLPVGTIIKDGDGFAVLPLENTNRLEWVRILDYRNPKDIIAR
jgi:rod shape-determining protein MreC